jgi:hypothetical protein
MEAGEGSGQFSRSCRYLPDLRPASEVMIAGPRIAPSDLHVSRKVSRSSNGSDCGRDTALSAASDAEGLRLFVKAPQRKICACPIFPYWGWCGVRSFVSQWLYKQDPQEESADQGFEGWMQDQVKAK